VFAALNLLVCLPLHAWVARLSLPVRKEPEEASQAMVGTVADRSRPSRWSPAFILMLAGFAFEGFILSAVLVQMVPLLAAVGLGASSVFVGTLFGPSQVASRLVNMLFGGGLRQTWLALGATGSLAAGLAVLLLTTPSIVGAVSFAILFGLGSGLMSIVGGTLPLELFGRAGYGGRVGWITAARQFSSAFAPFGFALMTAGLGVFPALWINVAVGTFGIVAFAAIARTAAGRKPKFETSPPQPALT
jgi:MFS family permease